MNRTYTDYLFNLFICGGPVSLEALLEQMEPAGKVSLEAYKEAKFALKALAQKGLVTITREGRTQYITLTEAGEEVSAVAAEIITAKMMLEWEQKALSNSQAAYSPHLKSAQLLQPA